MINIKKVKPMFTTIVTTMDKYDDDEIRGKILLQRKNTLKEYQRVVAVGTIVKDIKVGDLVKINPSRFAIKKHKPGGLKDDIIEDNPTIEYKFDIIEIDNTPHLLLQDRDVEFIIEEYEDLKNKSSDKSLILPEKKLYI